MCLRLRHAVHVNCCFKRPVFLCTSFTASPMLFHTTARQCTWVKSRPNIVQWTYQSQRCQHIRRKTWSNDLGLNFILKPENALWMYQVDSTSPTAHLIGKKQIRWTLTLILLLYISSWSSIVTFSASCSRFIHRNVTHCICTELVAW